MQKNKLFQFINNPPRWFVILSFITTIVFIVVTLVIITLDNLPIIAYFIFAVSAFLLTYSIYLIVRGIPKLKRMILMSMQKNKFTKAILEDWGFRASVMVIGSFTINFIYAIFHAIISILSSSIWYGALALYSILLGGMRFVIIKNNRLSLEKKERISPPTSWKIYRNTGIMLSFLSFVMAVAVIQMIFFDQHSKYVGTIIYAVAAYTFYKIIVSIINIIKAKKYRQPILQAIKNIGLADALMSLFSLQVALICAFSDGVNMQLMNQVVGTSVCSFTMVLGIIMVIQAKKNLLKKESNS